MSNIRFLMDMTRADIISRRWESGSSADDLAVLPGANKFVTAEKRFLDFYDGTTGEIRSVLTLDGPEKIKKIGVIPGTKLIFVSPKSMAIYTVDYVTEKVFKKDVVNFTKAPVFDFIEGYRIAIVELPKQNGVGYLSILTINCPCENGFCEINMQNSSCEGCNENYLLNHEKMCVYCPKEYFDWDPDYRTCTPKSCHKTCATCSETNKGPDGCTSCHYGAHLHEGACTKCDFDNKMFIDGKCEYKPCHHTCSSCYNDKTRFGCVTCPKSSFPKGDGTCQHCPEDLYVWDWFSKTCSDLPCHSSCGSCDTDKTELGCLTCRERYSFRLASGPPEGKKGRCVVCNLDTNVWWKERCMPIPCHTSCLTCMGVGDNDCLTCRQGDGWVGGSCVGLDKFDDAI